MTTGTTPHVVVIGGGIAGLAAAFYLRDEPVRVTVLEGSPRLGGKLSASDVAGVSMDEGAEALLARRPEGIALIEATGLAADLVPAGVTVVRDLHPGRDALAAPQAVHGRPGRPGRAGRHRGRLGRGRRPGQGRAGRRPFEAADTSVTEYIGARLGVEVVDRLVDPLLGGVYAGRSEDLSFQATLAPLAAAARTHADADRGRRRAAAARPAPRPPPPLPQITARSPRRSSSPSPPGSARCRRRWPRPPGPTSASTRWSASSTRTATGWRLTIGSAADPEYLDADAVILATPAAPTARLLKRTASEAAAELEQIPYASMAIITLAFRAGDFPAQQRSGYLVPAVDGRAVKAATFSTVKWPHLAQAADPRHPVHIVRCSVGRSGDVAVLQRDDDDLAALAAAELAEAIGITAQPVAHRVTRWGGGLPQYNVGHLDRVARIRRHGRRRAAARRLAVGGRRLRRRRHPGLHRHRPAVGSSARRAEVHQTRDLRAGMITGARGGATVRSTSLRF